MSQEEIVSVTCPACKGMNFATKKEGLVFKKTIYDCPTCGLSMETGNNHTFTIKKVGEDYSNAQRLLVGHEFKVDELAHHNIPIVTDTKLAEYAAGDIPDEMFHQNMETPIILKKNERIAFYLKGISYNEERRQRVSRGSGGYSFRVAKGVWYHTGNISGPQYRDAIQKIDDGSLMITSARYIFIGSMKNVDQPHSKIDAITPFVNGIGISRSNKQMIEYYLGNYHWPLIASVFMGIVKKSNQ